MCGVQLAFVCVGRCSICIVYYAPLSINTGGEGSIASLAPLLLMPVFRGAKMVELAPKFDNRDITSGRTSLR